MSAVPTLGQCLCGTVRFAVGGRLPGLYQCHCSLCRRQTGAAANAATLVKAERFLWLSGEEHIASWTRESGFRSDFCRVCGSPVPNPLRGTDRIWIPAGLLDTGGDLRIVAQFCLESRAGWDRAALEGQGFAALPDLAEVIALLDGDG